MHVTQHLKLTITTTGTFHYIYVRVQLYIVAIVITIEPGGKLKINLNKYMEKHNTLKTLSVAVHKDRTN